MTTTPYSKLIQNYNSLLIECSQKYGEHSQAVVFVSYEYLLSLCDIVSRDPKGGSHLISIVKELICKIQQLYWDGGVDGPIDWPYSKVLDPTKPLLQFDSSYYNNNYFEVGRSIQDNIIVVNHDVLRFLKPTTPYIYVVDKDKRLVVHQRPYRLKELLFGRNVILDSSNQVTHPMLVHDTLLAHSAGEIVFIGNEKVSMVVANTKSGHFRPPKNSSEVVKDVCQGIFNISNESVIVFSLFR